MKIDREDELDKYYRELKALVENPKTNPNQLREFVTTWERVFGVQQSKYLLNSSDAVLIRTLEKLRERLK